MIKELCDGPMEEFRSKYVPRKLSGLREQLCSMLQGVYRFQRSPATHIVIMISTESRSKKPYAQPVQCVPYGYERRKLFYGVTYQVDAYERNESCWYDYNGYP